MVYDKFRNRVLEVYRESIRNGSITTIEKVELSPAEFYALKLEKELERRKLDEK